MNWINTSSNFKYNGVPVTRIKSTCITPFGTFNVYEAVSGKCFYEHPFMVMAGGFFGYQPDPDQEFYKLRISCNTIQDGIKACEYKWEQVKKAVNNI